MNHGVDPFTKSKARATQGFGNDVEFGKTARAYSKDRAGFPDRFFQTLLGRKLLAPGMKALDVGTGTGTVARGLALAGAEVDALDMSPAMIAAARTLDQSANVQIAYHVGTAEELPFKDAHFDLVTAGQCWHWFDRHQAAQEIYRILKADGAVVLAHFDWIPLPGNMVSATEHLIQRFNPNWTMGGGTGMYPLWLEDLASAGFMDTETASFDMSVSYSHKAWRGRIQASAGIRACLSKQESIHFDKDLAQLLQTDFPEDPVEVPHRCWFVSGVRPGSSG